MIKAGRGVFVRSNRQDKIYFDYAMTGKQRGIPLSNSQFSHTVTTFGIGAVTVVKVISVTEKHYKYIKGDYLIPSRIATIVTTFGTLGQYEPAQWDT